MNSNLARKYCTDGNPARKVSPYSVYQMFFLPTISQDHVVGTIHANPASFMSSVLVMVVYIPFSPHFLRSKPQNEERG